MQPEDSSSMRERNAWKVSKILKSDVRPGTVQDEPEHISRTKKSQAISALKKSYESKQTYNSGEIPEDLIKPYA